MNNLQVDRSGGETGEDDFIPFHRAAEDRHKHRTEHYDARIGERWHVVLKTERWELRQKGRARIHSVAAAEHAWAER